MIRKPYPSRPDREVHSPDVYEILEGFDGRIGGLEQASIENKQDNSKILLELRDIKATDRHATAKLIAGLATTAILTIGGILGGQQLTKPHAPEQPQNVPTRSALDVKLDLCRPLPPGPSKSECFARVTAEDDH